MNLLLTDHLTCPRCKAGAGLILLAEQVAGRRVLAGQLGCPNCREQYPVRAGAVDFAKTAAAASAVEGEEGDAPLLAALLGVTEGPAMLLMLGDFEAAARGVAALVPEVEVVVASAELGEVVDEPGVSVLRVAQTLPLYDGSMRGVVVAGSALQLLAEAARVCALAARVVLLNATTEVRSALESLGLQRMSEQGNIMVAVRRA
jgi:uncharacterized protein YbaR (Trm112 family)